MLKDLLKKTIIRYYQEVIKHSQDEVFLNAGLCCANVEHLLYLTADISFQFSINFLSYKTGET